MNGRRIAACMLGLVAASGHAVGAAPAADEPAPEIRANLRDTGYLLGDLVDVRFDIDLPEGFRVDPASLPAPGRVAPWMELRRATLADGASRAGVDATYQIFAMVEQATRVPIPPIKLRLRRGDEVRAVQTPEKFFTLSPVLPPTLADPDREIKPAMAPQPLPTVRATAGFALAALAAAISAGFLLWAYDKLPFLPRAPGPFARLWRRWRRRRDWSEDAQTALLCDWLGALNAAARETVYPSTLPRLFAAAPFLQPLREPVEAMYALSWQRFYSLAPAQAPFAANEFLDLMRRAADRERGLPD